MSEISPTPEAPSPPESPSPPSSRNPTWFLGLVLIAIGGLLLFQNITNFSLDNWWALFILIPAFGSFATAWRRFQDQGRRVTGAVSGSVVSGLVLTMVAVVFLFNLDWGQIWPVFLILIGFGALLRAL